MREFGDWALKLVDLATAFSSYAQEDQEFVGALPIALLARNSRSCLTKSCCGSATHSLRGLRMR